MKLSIGAGRNISLTWVPGVWSLRKSKALVWLMPPMMKMSSPQLMTWLPRRTVVVRLSKSFKSLDTQASSKVKLRTAMSFASSESSVRRVWPARASATQVARASARQPSGAFRPNSWVPLNAAETMSPRL